MNASALVLTVGLLTMPLYAAESAIYKCMLAGEATYQGMPCEAGQAQQTLMPLLAREEPAVSQTIPTQSTYANPELRLGKSMTADALVAGMSDTKILNLREWGRPQHISRSNTEDGWHEEWTYLSRTYGTTVLRFVNGRLAGFGTADTQSVAAR